MVSGRERKIIYLKSTRSKRFDEAYLVLKDGMESYDDKEILKEAERILFSAEELKKKRAKKGGGVLKCAFFFSFGFFFGTLSYFFLLLLSLI